MYKSLIYWYDIEDDKRPYERDETYPRAGLKVTRARIRHLIEKGIIEKVKEKE